MPIRTIMTSVTFNKPFSLGADNDPQPAGKYTVETDEERLEGLSFTAYVRVRTLIHIPSKQGSRGIPQVLVVDPSDLEYALDLDAGLTLAHKDLDAEHKAPPKMPKLALVETDPQAAERSEDEGMTAASS